MKTILLVEDDKAITVALRIRLQSMGFAVATAPDAICAMNKAIQSRPDAILIDINLPGGNRFIVADRVRSSQDMATTPIVFITASKEPGLRKRASQYGAVAFLEKPFGAAALAEAVESCVGV